jgi:hypothetical protein
MFSLVRILPSPTSAENCSSLFGWFIGTVTQSDSSAPFMRIVRLLPSPAGLFRSSRPVGTEVSRFSCMLFLSVRRLSDYAGSTGPSRSNAASHVAFPCHRRGSAPCSSVFRSSIARPTDTPIYASTGTSRCQPQDSGPRWIRFLLSCTTLSFATTCRFNPAHPGKRRPPKPHERIVADPLKCLPLRMDEDRSQVVVPVFAYRVPGRSSDLAWETP